MCIIYFERTQNCIIYSKKERETCDQRASMTFIMQEKYKCKEHLANLILIISDTMHKIYIYISRAY